MKLKIAVLIFLLIIVNPGLRRVSAEEPSASPTGDKSEVPVANPDEEDISDTEGEQLANPNTVKVELPKSGTPWQPPDFSKQESALGWTQHTFDAPPGFEGRKKFWIDIYTKYTTHQALIHDAHYLDIIYKVVDLEPIDLNPALSDREKERSRRKLIKEEKKKIRDQLLHIQSFEDTPGRLDANDMEIFKKFRYVYDKKKFSAAADRHRLRMQLGQRDRFMLGIYYSGRYIREMENIFREEGVPIELTRLPFVESSFNLYARSRVGASGIWQFMKSTGRLYLKGDRTTVDLRNDPIKATGAAAKLLKSNYKLLGNWSLALTAYNHGPGGVSHIVKKMKTDDINEIVWNTTRRRFGFASENFYAEFLAALEVESHCDKYFGKIAVSPPLIYDEIELPSKMKFEELSKYVGSDTQVFNPFFNHEVLDGRRFIPKGFTVRVPKDQKEKILSLMTNSKT